MAAGLWSQNADDEAFLEDVIFLDLPYVQQCEVK